MKGVKSEVFEKTQRDARRERHKRRKAMDLELLSRPIQGP